MSGFSYPPPIFLSSTYNPAFYLSLDPSGFLSYAYAQTLYVSRNDYRLSYITGVTLGQGTAGLALTLDSGGNVSNINSLTAGSITASSLSGLTSLSVTGTLTATTVNATSDIQINGSSLDLSLVGRLNLATLGTCEASKAIVLDSSRSCKNIHNLEIASTGTGIVCSTLKFWNDAGTATETFNHRYLMGISEGGAANSKALVLNSTGQITGIGYLSGTTINATTLQIANTSITATAAQINKLATVTATAAELNKLAGCTTTTTELNYLDLTTGAGTAENSKALVLDGSGNIATINSLTANSIVKTGTGVFRSDVPAATNLTGGSAVCNNYNMICRNSSNTIGASTGICFVNDTDSAFASLTPSASIIAERTTTPQYDGSMISLWSKNDSSVQGGLQYRRMTIGQSIHFGQFTTGTANINLMNLASDSAFMIGSAPTAKNSFRIGFSYTATGSNNNYLYMNPTGGANALCVTANERVGVGTSDPASKFEVVGTSTNLSGGWQRICRFENDNSSPIVAEIQIINAATTTSSGNGLWFGTVSADPIKFGTSNSTQMYLNTSGRLGVGISGLDWSPEASIHAGGWIYCHDGFYRRTALSSASLMFNWSGTGYGGIGWDSGNGQRVRIGIANGDGTWSGYPNSVYGGPYTNGSDRRLKKNIRDCPHGLAVVMQMQPRVFRWKTSEDSEPDSLGFVAQELQPLIPEVVSGDESCPEDENGSIAYPMGIEMSAITAVLCKAIQELTARVEALEQALLKNT